MYLTQKNYKILLSQKTGSNIYHLRNACLGGDVLNGENQKPYQGKINYDFIFWIDSDSVFSPMDIEKLINHNKDVVSGLYLMSDGVHFATVEKGNWDYDKYIKNGGTFDFLKPRDILLKGTKLFPVEYTGFGFMCIKRGVLEKLKYPWFEPLYFEIDNNGKKIRDYCSEDVALCRKLIDNNIEILCDPTVIIGHEKMFIHHVQNNINNNINNNNIIDRLNDLANNLKI